MRILCAGALLVSGILCAADGPKHTPPPGTLHSLTITGNQRYAADEILKQTGLRVGQPVTAAQIEDARLKLEHLELFSKVSDHFRFSPPPVNYDVTFEVAEITQVFPMRFEALGVNGADLREQLKTTVPLYSNEIPATKGVLDRYRDAVQAYVAQRDPKLHVKVSPNSDDGEQHISILFTPDTPPPVIAQVKFSGNSAVDTGTLLRAANSVAVGIPYTETRVKQMLQGTIKPVYAAHGYTDVTFPSITTEPSPNSHGVILNITVKEGPIFTFGPIHFHGSGLDPDEVRSAIPFKPGQTYDATKVDDFRIDLQHRLRRRGYLDATVTTDVQMSPVNRSMIVSYNVVPGDIYNFSELRIHGLDVTTEPVIEKLWGEKPGKPFNPDYPDFFLKRVEDEKIFDDLANASSDFRADASTHEVIVHLYFKGGKSPEEIQKEKEQERQKRTVDGTWSPYPY